MGGIHVRVVLAVAVAVSTTLPPRLGWGAVPAAADREEHERAALLALRLQEGSRGVPLWVTITVAGLSAAGAMALVVGSTDEERRDLLPLTAGLTGTALATTASVFTSEDTRRDVLMSVGYVPSASALLSAALAHDGRTVPRLSSGALAAGYYGAAALSFVNALMTQEAPLATLRRHSTRLRTPAARSGVTSTELAQMEADFMTLEPVLHRSLVLAPVGVAGFVALVPAFEDDRPDVARGFSAALGGLALLSWVASALDVHPAAAYRSDVQNLEIAVLPTGAGAAFFGRF